MGKVSKGREKWGKWGKMGKSGENWEKWKKVGISAKSGEKLEEVGKNGRKFEKLEKVGKSGPFQIHMDLNSFCKILNKMSMPKTFARSLCVLLLFSRADETSVMKCFG